MDIIESKRKWFFKYGSALHTLLSTVSKTEYFNLILKNKETSN